MTQVLVVANQKGGVGKTTTAINIATALAAVDKKVLLVDLDPQANATTGLGVNKRDAIPTVYDLLMHHKKLEEVTLNTFISALKIVASSVDLVGAEVELVNQNDRHMILKKAFEACAHQYDFIIIDCPPAMGLLTLNAMVAANAVIVPLQCEYYALEGLSYLLNSIQKIQQKFNPQLSLLGIALTMYDKRSSLCVQVAEDVRAHLGNRVFETVIPRNVKVSEAPSHGKPVLVYDVNCLGSKAYMSLAKEILEKTTPATHSTYSIDDIEGESHYVDTIHTR